jgi:hypothetical protein
MYAFGRFWATQQAGCCVTKKTHISERTIINGQTWTNACTTLLFASTDTADHVMEMDEVFIHGSCLTNLKWVHLV